MSKWNIVGKLILANLGLADAIAVQACLEVAKAKWSEEDTKRYGTAVKEYVEKILD